MEKATLIEIENRSVLARGWAGVGGIWGEEVTKLGTREFFEEMEVFYVLVVVVTQPNKCVCRNGLNFTLCELYVKKYY